MPIDRPTAGELLAAVREHLREHVAPLLNGQPAFHLRVATNVLAIVERTIAEGAAMDTAELSRLRALLDLDECDVDDDLIELNRQLEARIRNDEMGEERDAVLQHLLQTATDKLRLANPRYMTSRD